MDSSCSFRITRTAEDLAQTINALSQRLVKLEQRLESIELQVSKSEKSPSPEEMKMLDGVDQLLRECQGLLETSSDIDSVNEDFHEGDEQEVIAA